MRFSYTSAGATPLNSIYFLKKKKKKKKNFKHKPQKKKKKKKKKKSIFSGCFKLRPQRYTNNEHSNASEMANSNAITDFAAVQPTGKKISKVRIATHEALLDGNVLL